MKVAAIQMVSGTEVRANLSAARLGLAQAAHEGAELAVLPEYFCLLGHSDRDKLAIAENPGSGPVQDFLAEQAAHHGLWIAGGTIPLASPDPLRVLNSSLVFNPQGLCMARYDKIHLFRFANESENYDEARTIVAGAQPSSFELASRDGHLWRIGLSVCYDLRFPELYRQLRAHLLLVPSAFTHTTGQAHWELLVRARALDNLVWVGAAAQAGEHDNGRRTWGHSIWVDPWGQVVACQPQQAACVVADLSMQTLRERRMQMPALNTASV